MKKQLVAWQFLAIPLFIYTTIIIIPFAQSLFFSMTDWNGLSKTFNFIGFANYYKVFTDPAFSNAVFHNFVWVMVFLVVPTILGLLLAVLMDRDLPGSVLFKSIIYLPMIFSYVIAGMIWTFIYEPRLGILNIFLRAIGLDQWATAWLAKPHTALISVITAAAWQHTGLCMIIYLAGLKGVRVDLLEAAKIDGCNSRQLYWNIVLPQLRNSTIIVVSLTVIHALKSFDIVYIMTKGGPFRASEVLTTLMYREAFWNYRMGYGSAIANMLFFLILILIVLYLRVLKQGED
ncbi:MAG: sugar ABC transporter permease [Candidatus Vecturithrix sp.]|jgi:multiple sugar transport system permease protein/raffinose/stachyose/melibiose transport system permease protein|nr:sugar ABC transporter permease [Candidatus Vecturithrix sp.]